VPYIRAGISTASFAWRNPERPVLVIGRTPNVLHVFSLDYQRQSFALQPGAARELDRNASERRLSDLRGFLEPGQEAAFDDWLAKKSRSEAR
jgi:hypothetical protein